MDWFDSASAWAGLLGATVGAVGGWLVPMLIGSLPEPPPAGTPDDRPGLPPAPPKEPYAAMARLPGLAWRSALAAAIAGAVVGLALGWTGGLVVLLPLVPVGVALAVIDWRTTLLPTRIVAPTYLLVVIALLVAASIDRDREDLIRAALGWAVMGGVYVVLWFVYPRGMGYGDVRLSGVLGLALGYLGWAELVTGLYGAFLVGGVGGVALAAMRRVNRKRFPFGPFMLVAGLVAVACGPWLMTRLGYPG